MIKITPDITASFLTQHHFYGRYWTFNDGFHMISPIAAIAGKNVQQSLWSYENGTSAIVAIAAFRNYRWRVVSRWSPTTAERFFPAITAIVAIIPKTVPAFRVLLWYLPLKWENSNDGEKKKVTDNLHNNIINDWRYLYNTG